VLTKIYGEEDALDKYFDNFAKKPSDKNVILTISKNYSSKKDFLFLRILDPFTER